MAQLNIYVRDELAADLKSRAKLSGKSLSTYVGELIEPQLSKPPFDWDAYFAKLASYGPCDIEITEADRYFGELRDINLD